MGFIMKVCIFGAGRMGRRHIKSIGALGLHLGALYDINPISLADSKKEFNLGDNLLFNDLDSLYANVKPDLVIISTNADSHCALVRIAAINNAKYIFVEKPMATSISECEQMIEVCKKNQVKLSVNHQMRFMEQYSLPKKLLESEAHGGLKSMTVIAGNCGLSMNGVHYFEAFNYLTGESIDRVSAWFSKEIVPNPRGQQYQDRAGCIRAETRSGVRLYMDISADQGHGVQVTYSSSLGFITVNELNGDMVVCERNEVYRNLPSNRYGMPSNNYQIKIDPVDIISSSASVLNALLDGRDIVSGEDGSLALKVLVAAYESAENGSNWVSISNGLNKDRLFPWA